jgi:hypothetical protein
MKFEHSTTFLYSLKPNNIYLSGGAAFTALCALWVYTSKEGMEFNIFAFFFVPLFILGIGLLMVTSYQLLQYTIPVTSTTQILSMWTSILLISLNPVLIFLCFIGTNKGDGAFFDFDNVFTAMLTAIIFYAILAACHFILFKMAGKPAIFSGFFVVGSSLWQVTPYLSGMIFVIYQLGVHYSETVNKYSGTLSPLVSCAMVTGILFMILNYMRYIKQPI